MHACNNGLILKHYVSLLNLTVFMIVYPISYLRVNAKVLVFSTLL